MITETKLEDGWRYDGDGRTETIATSGRYTHSIVHCGWAETRKRLTDADILKLFGEPCSRASPWPE